MFATIRTAVGIKQTETDHNTVVKRARATVTPRRLVLTLCSWSAALAFLAIVVPFGLRVLGAG